MKKKMMSTDVGRGVTGALISIGMTLVMLSPVIMMQIVSNFIK